MLKKILTVCAVFALALPVAAFAAAEHDTLRVGVAVDAKNFDPQNSVDAFSFSMQRQIYEPLVTVDGKTKQLVPVLIDSYELLDPETYKFHLKKGVKFHNGEEFTAEDVVFSLKRTTSPDSIFASSKGRYIDPDGFKIIDKHTVIVKTRGPVGGFLESMKHPYAAILSKKAVADAGKEYFRQPVGTGPYKFKSWVKGEHVDLEAFADYHGKKPNFPKMRFVILPDDSSRMIALETGKVDMIYAVPYNDYERLLSEKKVKVVEATGLTVLFLNMNMQNEKFKDVRVRRAIDLAINKEAYNAVVYNKHATVPTGPLPFASSFFPKEAKATGTDIEKAKALLKEAGVKDGMTLSLFVVNSPDRVAGATILQAMLGQVGITLDIQVMENAVIDAKMKDGNYDLFLGTWGMQTSRDAGVYWQAFLSSSAAGSTNKSNLKDPVLDGLIEKGTAIVDETERNVVFQQIWDRINETVPFVCLSIANEIYGGNKDLMGLDELYDGKINYLGDLYYKK